MFWDLLEAQQSLGCFGMMGRVEDGDTGAASGTGEVLSSLELGTQL